MSSENFIKKRKDIGERLKKVRFSLKKGSQEEFALILGTTQTSLSKYETGVCEIPDVIKIILSEFGINLHWLISGEGEMFLKRQKKFLESTAKSGLKRLPVYSESELPDGAFVVPLLDQRFSAGSGSLLPNEDEAKALIRVPAYLSRYGDKLAALPVDGDSMQPTLHRGDMVVCDSCGWSGEGVYALRMGGEGFVKRLTKRPGKIVILSDNPKYPPQEESEESQDIEVIGRVHCAITKVE